MWIYYWFIISYKISSELFINSLINNRYFNEDKIYVIWTNDEDTFKYIGYGFLS